MISYYFNNNTWISSCPSSSKNGTGFFNNWMSIVYYFPVPGMGPMANN